MSMKRFPFIIAAFFQLVKLVVYAFLFILVSEFDAGSISFHVTLLAGEFALLVLFAYGAVFPDFSFRLKPAFFIIKLFSAAGALSGGGLFLVERINEISANTDAIGQLGIINGKIILSIILIFIDLAIVFVLLLYKGEFEQKKKKSASLKSVPDKSLPDFDETYVEE